MAFVTLAAIGCSSPSPTPHDAAIDQPTADFSDSTIDSVTADVLQTTDVPHTVDTASQDAPGETVLRVRYPAGAHTVSLRGDGPGLDWNHGVAFSRIDENTYEWRSTAVTHPFEWKPLLDDTVWSRGPNYTALAGTVVTVTPRFETVTGTWSRAIGAFHSELLQNTRGVWVYLPPSYAENPLRSFPVVYMHDGQNLFDPSAAFGGTIWHVQDAMNLGAEDGTIAEAIVVGVENTPARIDEYTPSRDATEGAGGRGALYLRMLVEELKPFIDGRYRTLPGRDTTALVGSSLGGLISLYAAVTHADTFGLIGAMSPSTWWNDREIIARVAALGSASVRPSRIYVDSGDAGPSRDGVDDTRALAEALRAAGYRDGVSLRYTVMPGGQHNEQYWAERLPDALRFIVGPRRE